MGVRFAHAALQVLADDHDVDVLHIKGPAVDEVLLDGERPSVDADVLVRPAHVDRLISAMHEHGWSTRYRFEDGSAFEHASTLVHPFLAPVDVHRRFPGIDADAGSAFDRLWSERHVTDLAGMPCAVPSVAAQRLVLVIHAARAGRLGEGDITRSWDAATDDERAAVLALADDVGAQVALASGTGRLDDFVGAPGYELWKVLSSGDRSRSRLWVARVRAAPTRRSALRVAVRLVVPNRHRMEASLGRPPTPREVAAAYVDSARRSAKELAKVARGVHR
ncbi:nucleotidyltransferase family protein [Knoellia sp. CPCC 206435]|uniref:nucleotidyltransferase family protein n=1 Tax=Knoellia terrae TaxID=3404797 RepID=UPI003B436E26